MDNEKIEVAIPKAIAQLKKSERGRQVLKDFKAMMDNGANNLDSENGQALCILLLAAIKAGKREFLESI